MKLICHSSGDFVNDVWPNFERDYYTLRYPVAQNGIPGYFRDAKNR